MKKLSVLVIAAAALFTFATGAFAAEVSVFKEKPPIILYGPGETG